MAAPRYSVSRIDVGGLEVIQLRDDTQSLSVSVCPARGAELCALSYRGVELLHRALDFSAPTEPVSWYGHGQVLFPAVGRQAGAKYTWDGVTRDMPLHGFAKDVGFGVVRQGASEEEGAVLVVEATHAAAPSTAAEASTGKYAAVYPFAWSLRITFTVRDGLLTCRHTISNTASGSESSGMPFAIGNHITLRFPFTCSDTGSGGSASDGAALQAAWEAGQLHASLDAELLLTAGSLLSGTVEPRPAFLQPHKGMPLTEPCATNGVFGFSTASTTTAAAGRERECVLRVVQPAGTAGVADEWSVAVSHTISPPAAAPAAPAAAEPTAAVCDWRDVSDNRLFVLWGSPPTPTGSGSGSGPQPGFICPEPWVSGPDSLNSRKGLPVLAPGQAADWTFTVAVHVK